MATRMQQRRGTAAQWISTNDGNGPILAPGEIGFESDTNKFKIGDGTNHWVNLVYFTDAASAIASISDLVDGAPALLNTLNELAAALGDDPTFFTTVATNLSDHESDTTNVHGIADTSLLATKSYADTAEADAITAAGTAADTKISNAVAALTKSSVGLGNVDNTSDANKPVSTATQTALDAKASDTDLSDHTSATTNVHGILDTDELATKEYVTTEIGNSTVDQSALAGEGIDWNGSTEQFDIDSTVATKTYADDAADAAELAAKTYADNLVGDPSIDGTAGNTVKDRIDSAVSSLVDSAPSTLDTLNELAAALQDNPDIITDLQGIAAGKQDTLTAGSNIDITDDVISVTGLASSDISDFNTAALSANQGAWDTIGAAAAANAAAEDYADGLAINYDTAGSAQGAYDNAVSYVNGEITTALGTAQTYADNAETDANIYTDNAITYLDLPGTYDAIGSAATAEQNAKDYADGLAVNYDAAGSASTVAGDLSTHESDTSTHGVTSSIAGVDDTQTFTNKTISYVDNTVTVQVANVSDLTATASELNTLDGITASTTELNYVGGVTSSVQDQLDDKAPLDSPTFTGTVSGITKTMVGLSDVDNTSDADKPVSTATQTALDAKLALSGGTLTGSLLLASDPTQALEAVTKEYVDNTASGIVAKPQVLGATTANIDATYDNGVAGVGATLTHNTNGVFPAEAGGATGWAIGKGILVKNQTNKAHNGRYYISDMGSASTPYVLTRCSYCDEASEIPGAYIFVQDGTNAGTGWIQVVSDPSTFVVGTDEINVFQFSGSGTITAGNGIEVEGLQVSIDTDTTVDINTAQTLTNKTISAANNTLTIATTDLTDVTATAAEVNILDGATLDTAELNVLDGITATTAELNILDGATLTTTELNYVDGVTSNIQDQIDAKLSSTTASSTYAPLANPTFTGTVTLPQGKLTGGSTTVSSDTATTVSTVALADFTTMEYTVSIKQGSKIRSSKVLVQTDGTTVDSVEHSILETGGAMTGVNVTAAVSSTNAILTVTITNASTTNATVKVINTII
jgi:hypothetical protein